MIPMPNVIQWASVAIAVISISITIWSTRRHHQSRRATLADLWHLLDRNRVLIWDCERELARAAPLARQRYANYRMLHRQLAMFYQQLVRLIIRLEPGFGLSSVEAAIDRGAITSGWQLQQFLNGLPKSELSQRQREYLISRINAPDLESGTQECGYARSSKEQWN